MRLPIHQLLRRKSIFLIATLTGASVLWFLWPTTADSKPEATILPANYFIPPHPGPIPDRWMPTSAGWGWLWKLNYAVFGKPAEMDIDTRLIRLTPPSDYRLNKALSKYSPLTETNGVRAWILPEADLRTLRQTLERIDGCQTIAQPRMTTGHTVQANLSVTATVVVRGTPVPVGTTFSCLSIAHGKTADLTIVLTHSEASTETGASAAAVVLGNAFQLHTNLMLAARLQIPQGCAALLLDSTQTDPQGRCVGVLINSKVK